MFVGEVSESAYEEGAGRLPVSALHRIFRPPRRSKPRPVPAPPPDPRPAPPSSSQPSPAPPSDAPTLPGPGRVIRVTDERDGLLINRMYPYWSSCWIGREATPTVYLFCGHADGRPRFFHVNLTTDEVTRLGSLLGYGGEAEGWSWDREGGITLTDGPRLRRVNPFTGEDRVLVDISATLPDHDLWQAHSSDDGRVHSATVRRVATEGSYPKVATVVYRRGALWYTVTPTVGELDESQVDPTGEYLLIKETPPDPARVWNRIFHLPSGRETVLRDVDGAIGHSDCGPGYVIGANAQVGACERLSLADPLGPRASLVQTWNPFHVSVKGGRCLLSDGERISLVGLDGSGVTSLVAHGMIGNDYDHQVMANLDPTGQVACWMSNQAGRMDLYLLVL